jgi:3-hydroxymyristoyl/3-hydroxydecanoyl-(acyl carrier protein) dehydratase
MMKEELTFTMDDILGILPHRPPFLFVDKVVKLLPDKTIICERTLMPDEPHFAGHFPVKPIMPGVLVTDALAQTSGLLWGLTKKVNTGDTSDTPEIFFLASVSMKFTHPAKPGDILRMTAHKDRSFGNFHTYEVEAVCGRNVIAKGSLTLAMKEGGI